MEQQFKGILAKEKQAMPKEAESYAMRVARESLELEVATEKLIRILAEINSRPLHQTPIETTKDALLGAQKLLATWAGTKH